MYRQMTSENDDMANSRKQGDWKVQGNRSSRYRMVKRFYKKRWRDEGEGPRLSSSQCWMWQSNCQSAWLVVCKPDPQGWQAASRLMLTRDKQVSYFSAPVAAYTALIKQQIISGRVWHSPLVPLQVIACFLMKIRFREVTNSYREGSDQIHLN